MSRNPRRRLAPAVLLVLSGFAVPLPAQEVGAGPEAVEADEAAAPATPEGELYLPEDLPDPKLARRTVDLKEQLARELEAAGKQDFPEGVYAKVLRIGKDEVEAVVMAIGREGAGGPPDPRQAQRLAQTLKNAVLAPRGEAWDFVSGSQFVVIGAENIEVEGAGPQLTETANQVGRAVLRTATDLGLATQHMSLAAYAGPLVAIEIEAQGVDLAPSEQERLRGELEGAIRSQVFGRRYRWVGYLPEESRVEVLNAARPQDEQLSEPVPVRPLAPAPTPAPSAAPTLPPTPAPDPSPPPPDLEPEPGPGPTPGGEPAPEPGRARPARAGRRPGAEATASLPSVDPIEVVAPPRPVQKRTRDFAQLVREMRARSAWQPPLPVVPREAQEPGPEPPVKYPAAPFAVGPGVASEEFFLRFKTDKSDLLPGERARLEAWITRLDPTRIRGVEIVGHADERHTDPYNMALGKRRAETVAAAIAALGVKPARIEAMSCGERSPLLPGHDDYAWSVNRRCEVFVSYHDPDRPMHRKRARVPAFHHDARGYPRRRGG